MEKRSERMTLQNRSITELGSELRAGQLSVEQLVELFLSQIEHHDGQIHAWAAVDADGALEQARRLDGELRNSQDRGPLHGIPIGIKDIIDVAGLPTRAGSPLRDDHVAQHDARVVLRLRKAGAVILGKTVTCEFACFDPSPTRNPWNVAHTPGGSSSGSAAAVSMQMCVAALGSQTGGSITRPASYCGIAGLKSTHDVVPTHGVLPVSQRLDHVGVFARSVGDLHVVFEKIASLREPTSRVPVGFESTEPPSIFLIEEFFLEQAESNVLRATNAALERIGAVLAKNATPLPDSFQSVHEMLRRIMAFDLAQYHREQFAESRERFGPNVASLIEEGLAVSQREYEQAVDHQHLFQQEIESIFKQDQIAITPATNTTAPPNRDTTGNPLFNSPWSYAGLPTVCIPCGVDDAGMPCGLQLIGPRNSELKLLAAAAWCETKLGSIGSPPALED